jgi:RNA polymerase sigma-70 factor (ECF subfamily)
LIEAGPEVDTNTELATAFMAHRSQLAAFLRAHMGSGLTGIDVEDVLQDLWLRCCRTDAVGVSNPRSYLFRMGHNLVLNLAREAARARLRDAEWGYVNNRDKDAVEMPSAERVLLAHEQLALVDETLVELGDRTANIFRRYRIDGVDQRRIAEEFGVSLSTVEKDLRKAYDALLALGGRHDEV